MDFFVSYNKADRAWAEWIAWQLEAADYTTVIQAWDFRPGGNFVLDMHEAAKEAERTIAVLSPDYLIAHYTLKEWAAALSKDALLPVRVRECKLDGLLHQVVYIDLVGDSETGAKEKLLAGVRRGRAKPGEKTPFPGSGRAMGKAPRFPGALPEIWNIPHLRNPHFTGREDQLAKLREALTAGGAAAIVPISGLGGTGKTQLALEYAYRHAPDYDVIWWLRAEDPTAAAGDYAALAEPLGVGDKASADQPAAIAAVRTWLEHHPKWLLIFDNARQSADSGPYMPAGSSGHILITSRDQNWGRIAKRLQLAVLPRAEAVEFLHKRSGRDEPAAAAKLCELLGDLPLALDLAGAYIDEAGMSVAEYLRRYRDHPDLVHGPVAATWDISVERLRSETPTALDLLNLVAFLAPDDIDPALVAQTYSDELEFDRARKALRRYSLIDVSAEALAVHRLLQAVTRERLARERREGKWADAAVKLVNKAFPFKLNEVETWAPSARLLPHALIAGDHAERLGVALETTSRLLNEAGLYMDYLAQLEPAAASYKRSLGIAEKVYGPDHPEVAIRANNIGQILKAQGDLEEALQYTQRALAIDEKVYGTDDPNVARDANNIGQILLAQGDPEGALRYTQRALAIDERAYGPDHPKVAIRANNIGQILKKQGDLIGALQYTQRALVIDEKVFGPDHPEVATDANNIGQILKAQGDLEGALRYTQRALAIDEKVYGPDHPNVATDANNIGQILLDQGDLGGALRYAQRALAIDEKVYGPAHPEVATDANNIGLILLDQGDLEGALQYTQRALAIDEKVYGPDNPKSKKYAANLAAIEQALEKKSNP